MEDPQLASLFKILMVFAGLVTVAIVAGAVCLVSTLISVNRLSRQATEFMDRWQPVADTAEKSINEFSEQSSELLSRANHLTASLHKQSVQLEGMVSTLSQSTTRNVEEIDAAVRHIVERTSAATDVVEKAVQAPAKKLQALAAGIGAAVRRLAGPGPTSPDRISTDEDMFI